MEESRREARTLKGIVSDRTAQLRWAGISSIALVLPASACTILAFTFLAIQVASLRNAGEGATAISRFIISYCLHTTLFLVTLFGALGALNFLLILRTSAKVIGPVGRLEEQLRRLINGEAPGETILRSGDYLENLSLLVNQLSRERLSRGRPSREDETPPGA